MLSGRGLCDELITRPEESYQRCCVVVCDLETSRMGAPYIYDISRLRVKALDTTCYVKFFFQKYTVIIHLIMLKFMFCFCTSEHLLRGLGISSPSFHE